MLAKMTPSPSSSLLLLFFGNLHMMKMMMLKRKKMKKTKQDGEVIEICVTLDGRYGMALDFVYDRGDMI